jgi:hypothetical protein
MLAALPPTPAQAQAPGADLKVLSPRAGDALGTSAFSLDVSFRSRSKSPVTTAELWVDGVRWVRQDLTPPQTNNLLQFAVDASTLAEGTHNVVVKVFCANGASSQTQLQIVAGDNNGVVEGKFGGPEVTFQTPINGKRVQGSVELLLDAPAKNGVNPYITIYVDKQFKTLKNYPPYSYTWDTTTVPNGFHTVEATGYLESSTVSTTRRIKVFVDNPGGNTTIQKDVADLSAPGAGESAAGTTAPAVKRAVGPLTKRVVAVGGVGRSSAVKRTVIPPVVLKPEGEPVVSAAGIASVDAASVRSLGLADEVVAGAASAAPQAVSAADLPLVMPFTPDEATPTPAAKVATAVRKRVASRTASRRVKATALIATAPAVASPIAKPASAGYVAPAVNLAEAAPSTAADAVTAAPLATIAAPTLTIKPNAPHLMAPAAKAPVIHAAAPFTRVSASRPRTATMAAKGGVRVATSATGPRTVVKPHAVGMLNAPVQVAYDGQQIAFDVPPRVEAGLPIAPFRQIFEQTGGRVMWHQRSRVVRAINADREVVITVGKNKAQVNGQSFTMDRAATLERGRTIVPLSFVGQALDVNVKYDPATGHLEISSK